MKMNKMQRMLMEVEESIERNRTREINTLPQLEKFFEENGLDEVIKLNYQDQINPVVYDAFYERHIDLY